MLDELMMATGTLAAAASLPGSLVLGLLSAAALAPRRAAPTAENAERRRLAIVVPAHDESASITATVAGLRAECAADGHCDLWVIADNCSDDTADLARAAGARVIERENAELRGKGYALDTAFKHLAHEDYAWFIVIDADSAVRPGFLAAMRRAMQPAREALQALYLSRPAVTPRGRVARLAQWGYNHVRPLGRQRLGGSAGLFGNGFALRRELIERVPYCAHSVVEDLEYHIALVEAGVRVEFVEDALVHGEIAESSRGARTQRTRWEGGRLRMLRERTPDLARGVAAGRGRLVEPLADLLLLPLGLHVLLLALAFLGGLPGLVAAALGAAGLALYVLAILLRGPTTRADVLALFAAPWYLAWKLTLLPATFLASRRKTLWTRAERAVESGAKQ